MVLVLLAACSKPAEPQWAAGVAKFRENRARSIGGPEGWIAWCVVWLGYFLGAGRVKRTFTE